MLTPQRHSTSTRGHGIIAALVTLLVATAVVALSAQKPACANEWVATGPPPTVAQLVGLPDGSARIVGWSRYVPATGDWVPAGPLLGQGGVATVLRNGTVLVTGLSAAEVYDPASETARLTGAMKIPRRSHQATVLPSGQVLVSGGTDATNILVVVAELYDPATGTWRLTGVLNIPRSGHVAALLPTGQVLAVSGRSAEVYDPASETWMVTAAPTCDVARGLVLPRGNVLVVGSIGTETVSQTYDPGTSSWSSTTAAFNGALTLLTERQVMVVDPHDGTTHLYDPATNSWSGLVARLAFPAFRSNSVTVEAVALPDGRALAVYSGRFGSCGSLCFPLVPGAALFRPDNTTPRMDPSPQTLDFGEVLLGAALVAPIVLKNAGESSLTGTAVLDSGPDGPFSLLSGQNFTVAPGTMATLMVRFTPSRFGAFGGSLKLMSNGGWFSVGLKAAVGLEVSGRVTGSGGVGLPLNTVQLRGSATASAVTDGEGRYSFFVQPTRGYTVTPSGPGQTFTPSTRSVLVETDSVGGIDFAVQTTYPFSLSASVLPGSRSTRVGMPATMFATIIASGSGVAHGCAISPLTSIPGSFLYYPTSPATNAISGPANVPVSIPGGSAQTFYLAFTPAAPFGPTDVELEFRCLLVVPAPVFPGVSTVLLSASTAPVPDIVALAVTPTANGILEIPGDQEIGAFAVATINMGAAGMMTVSADTGVANLPVTLYLCRTNPATGQCVTAEGPTVTAPIDPSATSAFAIFVAAHGPVHFDPAVNRVFVRFRDSTGQIRGSTSVAVTTVH